MELMDYASDPEKELAGVTVPIDDETTITVAAYGNRKFREMRNRLLEPYQKAAGRGEITTKQADSVLAKCIAEHILLGWTGLKIQGEDFPYTKENCRKLMADARFKSFKEVVIGEAATVENYKLERLDDDLGNFGSGQSTKRGGRKTKKKASKKSS